MTSTLPPLAPLTRLTPLIYRLTGGNPGKFTLQGTNTYLLGRGPQRILIDTGQGFPHWSEHLHKLLDQESAEISTVLLTHHHLDHIDGLKDVPPLRGSSSSSSSSSKEATQKAFRHPAPPSTQEYRDMLQRALDGWARPIGELSDGMEFSVPGAEGVVLRAVHAPGHTPDHCVFLLEVQEEENVQPVLFTGDAVLGHGTAVFEDLAVYMASLDKMRAVVSGVQGQGKKVLAYPAHGEVIGDAGAKIEEYIEHRAQRERQVLDVLRDQSVGVGGDGEGSLPMDLVKVIYKDYPESLHVPAEGGVRLILKKLLGEGKAEQLGERWKVGGEDDVNKQRKAGL